MGMVRSRRASMAWEGLSVRGARPWRDAASRGAAPPPAWAARSLGARRHPGDPPDNLQHGPLDSRTCESRQGFLGDGSWKGPFTGQSEGCRPSFRGINEKGFEHLRRVNSDHATVHAFLSFHPSLPLLESSIRFPRLPHPSPGFSRRLGDIRETEEPPRPLPRERHGPRAGLP